LSSTIEINLEGATSNEMLSKLVTAYLLDKGWANKIKEDRLLIEQAQNKYDLLRTVAGALTMGQMAYQSINSIGQEVREFVWEKQVQDNTKKQRLTNRNKNNNKKRNPTFVQLTTSIVPANDFWQQISSICFLIFKRKKIRLIKLNWLICKNTMEVSFG
jgi:hypothetical protein